MVDIILDSIERFKKNTLLKAVFAGVELAKREHGDARVKVCSECPLAGKVEVMGINMDGCTECGCPFATKPYMLNIPRLKDKMDEPLSFDELIKLRTNKKSEDFEMVKITCPHPNGNKWSQVDNTFLNLKK